MKTTVLLLAFALLLFGCTSTSAPLPSGSSPTATLTTGDGSGLANLAPLALPSLSASGIPAGTGGSTSATPTPKPTATPAPTATPKASPKIVCTLQLIQNPSSSAPSGFVSVTMKVVATKNEAGAIFADLDCSGNGSKLATLELSNNQAERACLLSSGSQIKATASVEGVPCTVIS